MAGYSVLLIVLPMRKHLVPREIGTSASPGPMRLWVMGWLLLAASVACEPLGVNVFLNSGSQLPFFAANALCYVLIVAGVFCVSRAPAWVLHPFHAGGWDAVRMKEIAAPARHPHPLSRWAPLAGACSLLGAALLIAALFPTFVSQVCPGGCVGISASLGESPDAWAVAWIAAILAATAVFFLAGIPARQIAMLNALAAVAALGLAVFEGAMAFPRVLDAAEDVPGGVVYALGPGYYLVLIGAVLAAGSGAAMLLTHRESDRGIDLGAVARRWGGRAICQASLCLLALACVGTFLPFVTVSCGFGCPPLAPPWVAYSGSLIGGVDGPIVIALLAFAALATAVRISGQGKMLASSATLFLSLAAAVLVSVASLNGATRVLGWPYAIPTVPDAGYYVVQITTALSVVLSALLVTADHPTWGGRRRVRVDTPEPVQTA